MLEPSKLPSIFCREGGVNDRSTIPDSKIVTGSASWKDGFPVETQKPLDAGGIAPRRQDFNEMFYLLSESIKYTQNGGLWSYSASLDYKPLDLVTHEGAIYQCITANGASSTVVAPSNDTFERYWTKLFDTNGRKSMLEKAYPIGSVYITISNSEPSVLFGFGTWRKLQGRFLLGSSATYANGSTGGVDKVTLSTSNIPSHSHTVTVQDGGSHSHSGSTGSSGNHNHTATTASAGSHTHTGSTSTTGEHSHTRGTMEITGTFIVDDEAAKFSGAFYDAGAYRWYDAKSTSDHYNSRYAGFMASKTWTGNTSNAGSHSHTITATASGSHSHSLTTDTTGAHTHTVSINNGGSHSHAATVSSVGSGDPVQNMPPYLVVNMWERVA